MFVFISTTQSMIRTVLICLLLSFFSCNNNSELNYEDRAIINIPNDSSIWKIKDRDQFLFFPSDTLFMSLSLVKHQQYYMDSLISEDETIVVNSFFEKENDHYILFGNHWNKKVELTTTKTSDSSFVLTTINIENGLQKEYELEAEIPLNSMPTSPLNIWQKEYYSLKQDTLLKYVNNGEEKKFTYLLSGQELNSFTVIPYKGEADRLIQFQQNDDTLLINPVDKEIYYLQKDEISCDKGIIKEIQNYNLRIRNFKDSIEMVRITEIITTSSP